MSYLNQAQDPRRRATAIVTAGAINALLAAGLVVGLATDFEKIVESRFIARNIPLPPPPRPEPKPTPSTPVERAQHVPSPPIPPIDVSESKPIPRVEVDEADPWVSRVPDTPRVEVGPGPAPNPAFPPRRATARNGNWITDNDYPRRALVDEAEGSVGYRLAIGTDGRVAGCELTRPSGNRSLDDATCRLITSRARFEPATDETGAKVPGTFTGSVRWQIPE
jgi:protein TonB